MRKTVRTKAWGRCARIAALGASILLLAGCATGYNLVQPNVAGSGSYYTSSEPYTGQGYYDEYGTGPYYPGTSGWGYYNGSFPYGGGFGYFGGYGNWPIFFNVGFSSVWDFPGYWGPWYTTILPFWSDCRYWRCGEHRHHHHPHNHSLHGQHDPVATNKPPRPWLSSGQPRLPSRWLRGAPPVEAQAHAVNGFVNRRPLASASFAPHDSVRVPMRQPTPGRHLLSTQGRPLQIPLPMSEAGVSANPRAGASPIPTAAPRDFTHAPIALSTDARFAGTPARAAYTPRAPIEPAFVNPRAMSRPTPAAMPRDFSAPQRPAFRSTSASQPSPRRADNSSTKTKTR